MNEDVSPVHPVPAPSVLLAASFDLTGRPTFRDDGWRSTFGDAADAWARLGSDDRAVIDDALSEAAQGFVVTHLLVGLTVPERDEPLHVLLHVVPVFDDDGSGLATPRAVSITAEALAEPTSFTQAWTRRSRFELVGRLTTGVVHDLNNLLASILGHLELVKAQETLTDDARLHWETIDRAALDGARLISRIQRFLRREKEETRRPVNLAEVTREAIAFTQPYWQNEARRRNVDIRLMEDLRSVDVIPGSASELREVLVNLILNATQAMPGGGTLLVRTWQDREGVFVAVSDTGVGMTGDVQARIFEPMFTTKGESGNGMGLAIAASIVQAHHGSVQVDSTPGAGSVFRLHFPRPNMAVASASLPTLAGRAKLHVLLVDDDPRVGDVLRRLLALRGIDVTVCASGEEAIAHTALGTVDVLVTDFGMPGMNGCDLAARVRDLRPDLPIVLLTGDSELGLNDRNIDVVFPKPFKADDVAEMLRRLVASSRAPSTSAVTVPPQVHIR